MNPRNRFDEAGYDVGMATLSVSKRENADKLSRRSAVAASNGTARKPVAIQVSITDMKYDFKPIEAQLKKGGVVHITRRGRTVAQLVPADLPPAKGMPDFAGRLKRLYGDKKLTISTAELLAADRDRF